MLKQKYINELLYKIVGCEIEVHKNLGPGLLESVYEACMIEELKVANLKIETQKFVPVIYKGKETANALNLIF